jgi:DNA-binding NarL/FixJ family response regulator
MGALEAQLDHHDVAADVHLVQLAVHVRERPRTICSLSRGMSFSETRVLRYLPTHLTVHDIAGELFLSANTVSAH